MAKLEVQIGADSSELNAEIAAAEYKIARLRKERAIQVKLGLDAVPLKMQIDKAQTQLAGLKKSVNSAGSSFTGMAPKVANGGNALIQFSRIAQDAPYGIIGVGNNITATAESFSYLRAQTGSTGGALKALGSSLMGTGGILLAVSLLTTAFTLLSQSGLSVGDVFDKITGKTTAFGSALKKASEEAAKSAIEEIGALQGLIAVAQSETVSRKARTQAVKDLQNQYPAYFGNLSTEQIMYGNLTGAIKDVTQALISKGIAEKLTKDAVEPTLDLWRARAKLNKAKAEAVQLEKDLAKETAKRVAGGFGGRTSEEVSLKSSIANTKLAIKSSRQDIKDLTVVVDSFKKGIEEASKASADLLIKAPKAVKEAGASSAAALASSKIKGTQQSFGGGFIGGGIVNPNLGLQATETQNANIVPDLVPEVNEQTLLMQQALMNFNDSANSIIMGSIAGTFGNLGSAIGEALATGGNILSAVGQTILQGLSSFLSDMGGELIKYGTLAVVKGKLDLAILTGGAVSVAAGIAAIGVGVALKAAGAAIGSATSGRSGSSTPQGGNSYQSPRSSGGASSFSGSSGGNVVFEISGQSLIGVLSNSLDKNRRLGGTLGIV